MSARPGTVIMLVRRWLSVRAFVSTGCAGAPDAPVRLPDAVLRAVDREAPGARVRGHEREDLRIEAYEVELELDGRPLELTIASDGTVVEREEAVLAGQLPQAASTGIARASPERR